MALVHPGKPGASPTAGELHPVVYLLIGFALMVGIAFGVHGLFSLF